MKKVHRNEFHLDAAKIAEMKPGQVIPADAAFAAGQKMQRAIPR